MLCAISHVSTQTPSVTHPLETLEYISVQNITTESKINKNVHINTNFY